MFSEMIKAAEQGDDKAQFYLGMRYYKGEGVLEDIVEAYKWFLLAGFYGTAQASDMRGRLVAKMTPEQIIEAQERVKQWRLERRGKEQSHPAMK